ncbi:hypothetical protein [Synechococcus sp. CCAP 1479/9]|uniref:hypothetical protein n=1 Tax=Synechococcus sp. CCAP 1479/9 TaxID=1221593 RepID=UPI001C221D77|nr:hypothetical protein [Synechococcus sp. CCAP 1479/9]
MAPIEDGLAAPAGMLLISKEGEQDRIIYPVHADGWRRLGWTIHPPQPELELEDDGDEEDGEPAALEAESDELLPAGLLLETGGQDHQERQDKGASETTSEPLELERLTKPQIVAAVRERFGVLLDGSQTRAELLAAAEELMAGEAHDGESIAGASGQGENSGEVKTEGDGQSEGEELVPSLLI